MAKNNGCPNAFALSTLFMFHLLLHLLHLPSFPYHLGIGVHVFVGGFDRLLEGDKVAAILFLEFLGIFLFFKGPFGPLCHDAHLVSTDDPGSLFCVDQVSSIVVSDKIALGVLSM